MIAKIIIILLTTLSLGIGISSHGKKREPHNAWYSILGYLLWYVLLYYSGFFNNLLQ